MSPPLHTLVSGQSHANAVTGSSSEDGLHTSRKGHTQTVPHAHLRRPAFPTSFSLYSWHLLVFGWPCVSALTLGVGATKPPSPSAPKPARQGVLHFPDSSRGKLQMLQLHITTVTAMNPVVGVNTYNSIAELQVWPRTSWSVLPARARHKKEGGHGAKLFPQHPNAPWKRPSSPKLM